MIKMDMHPKGPEILGAMSTCSEYTVTDVAKALNKDRNYARPALDWLVLAGYLNKRRCTSTNLNHYQNMAHKTEIQKAQHSVWVNWREEVESE